MKHTTKIAVLLAGLFGSLAAMGGHGTGGGVFGITTGLLRTFSFSRALLAYEGSTWLPESNDVTRLVIPQDEYIDFVQAVEDEVSKGGKPLTLSVETNDGGKRYFALKHVGSVGQEPVIMYLVETAAPDSDQ